MKSDAVITIRVPAAIKDALEAAATRDRRKLSAFCALILEDAVTVAPAPVEADDVPAPAPADQHAASVAHWTHEAANAPTPSQRKNARLVLKRLRSKP